MENNSQAQQVEINGNAKSNFGGRGWMIIIYYGVMLFLSASLTTSGINVFAPLLAEKIGYEEAILIAWNGYAGWFGVVGALILSILAQRFGAKRVMLWSLFVAAFGFGGLAFIRGLGGFAICMILVNVFTNGCTFCSGSVLLARWFPTRTGMAVGYSTIGNSLASVIFIPIFNLLSRLGFNWPYYGYFIFMIALFFIGFAVVANNPEDVGKAPDNDPANAEQIKAMQAELAAYESPWTTGKLLKDREVWLMGIGYGCILMSVIGLVSQFVPRGVVLGWERPMAITLLTISAACACVASFLWGVIDQKIGTKICSILLECFFIASILFNIFSGISGNKYLYIIAGILMGCGLGGSTNFPTSMCTRLFGRKNFQRAFAIVLPLTFVLRALASVVMGNVLRATGYNYAIAYMIFAIFDVLGIICFICIRMQKKPE